MIQPSNEPPVSEAIQRFLSRSASKAGRNSCQHTCTAVRKTRGSGPASQLLHLKLRPILLWNLARILAGEGIHPAAELGAQTAGYLRRIAESGTFGLLRN